MRSLHPQLSYLFNRYKDGTATAAEQDSFLELVKKPELEEALMELIAKETELFDSGTLVVGKEQSREKANEILQRILQTTTPSAIHVIEIPSRKKFWWKWAAAAFFIISAGAYLLLFNKSKEPVQIVKTEIRDVEAPSSTKAIITLADGSTVTLDSLVSLTQNNVEVAKNNDGSIIYRGNSEKPVYNMLYNPRGSKVVQLRLSDGTRVWLNSESSLRYPVAFSGNTRMVEITGEAYFEVAKDPGKKFIVTGKGIRTEVLGTHFNINTYSDEPSINVTLLEGSVRVSKGGLSGLLQPGEQAQVTDKINVKSNADVAAVMAWKNGEFSFNNSDLKTIMRQVEKWYDVDVVFQEEIAEKFRFRVSRNTRVSHVFSILEETGFVHFTILGRTITVLK